MTIKKGDFILVDYVVKIKETGETFDTTLEDEAKKGGIFKENTSYESMFIIVGEGWILKKIDNSLIGIEANIETTIEVPPKDGFGLRDPTKIKVIPISRLKKQKITPFPGAQIEIDEKTAVVRSIGAGRVQIDFNPPLAGKTLIYDLTIKKIIDEKLEQIKHLIHRRISNVNFEKFNLNLTEKEATIEMPEEALYLQGIQFAKRGIAADLQTYFSIEKIVFTEVFMKPSSPPSEEPPKQVDDLVDTQSAP